jgi:hypothetical protein
LELSIDGILKHLTVLRQVGDDLLEPAVLSSHDLLMAGRNWQTRNAVVVDDSGHYEALGVAEQLVSEGADVTFVTPFKQIGFKVESALMVETVLERIAAAAGRITVLTRHRVRAVHSDTVEIAPTYAGPSRAQQCDTVVMVTPNAPMRDLYDELAGQVQTLAIVGDANSPRNLQKAVYEGHVAARCI